MGDSFPGFLVSGIFWDVGRRIYWQLHWVFLSTTQCQRLLPPGITQELCGHRHNSLLSFGPASWWVGLASSAPIASSDATFVSFTPGGPLPSPVPGDWTPICIQPQLKPHSTNNPAVSTLSGTEYVACCAPHPSLKASVCSCFVLWLWGGTPGQGLAMNMRMLSKMELTHTEASLSHMRPLPCSPVGFMLGLPFLPALLSVSSHSTPAAFLHDVFPRFLNCTWAFGTAQCNWYASERCI